MSRIVLASGSPRRQELLNRIGITDFDIRVPQTDEHYPAGLTPAQIVEYISREKADAAAKLCTPLLSFFVLLLLCGKGVQPVCAVEGRMVILPSTTASTISCSRKYSIRIS